MAPTRIVRSVHDLPAYEYRLDALPSEVLTGPLDSLLELAERLVRDDDRTLAEYAVDDPTLRQEFVRRRLHLAMLHHDWPLVASLAGQLRARQDRLDRQATEGLLEEITAMARESSDPDSHVAALLRERLSGLPGRSLTPWLKQARNALAYAGANVVVGLVRAGLDPVAAANGGRIDAAGAAQLLTSRVQIDCLAPVAAALTAGIDAWLNEHPSAEDTDIWAARQVTLRAESSATTVPVGIWDTGVDLSLFRAAEGRGLAYDRQGRRLPNAVLRPLGDAEPHLPELFDLLRGLLDVQMNVGSPSADAFRQRLAAVAPADTQAFTEAIGLVFQYSHGTLVAQVAVDGNPFARVFAAAMHWPVRPDEAHVDRDIMARLADRHTEAVREMQAAGVRVVNMSWGVMPQTFEALLARQGGIDDAQERKRCAAEFLAIERRALEGAIRSAPEILFVAAAGNSADDADFADIVPSNLALPNLITVGAVDRSGQEAPFTTVGRTVALHANGVEVASVLPGGTALRISGTSVAAPQVTNTAAKLVACRPGFTGAELRALLIESAEPAGRLRRLHPRRAFEVAQIPLP